MAELASTRVFGKLTVMHEAILKANAEIVGNVTATKFIGDGSQLTALPWGQLTGVPSTFAPSTHNHDDRYYTESEIDAMFAGLTTTPDWSDILNKPATATRWPAWGEVTGKPSTFTPSSHEHPWSEVTGKPTTATRWPTWSEVTGKPSTFAPSSHTHPLSQITGAGDLASLSTNDSTSNFLRGDGTWATPPNTNTTYSEISTAEIDAGTASTLRTISGRRMKYALDKKSDTGHGHSISDVTGLQAAIDSKANTSTQVIAGTGLSGGGTLAANRTLSVNYGTTAGTAAQGNDSRLSNSREWTASTVPQTEAEAGTATTRRAWTAQRVRQAVAAWWNSISSAFGRGFVNSANAADARTALGASSSGNTIFTGTPAQGRSALGLGNSATTNVTTSTDNPSGGSDGDVWLKVES